MQAGRAGVDQLNRNGPSPWPLVVVAALLAGSIGAAVVTPATPAVATAVASHGRAVLDAAVRRR